MTPLWLPLLLLVAFPLTLSADEVNEFRPQYERPPHIPPEFNGKPLHPLIAGDFAEFFELWTGPRQVTPTGAVFADLFLMKTKYKHRSYEGVKIGTIPDYGADFRLLPVPGKDYLVMTNGRALEIYTLWGKTGKRTIHIKPNRSFRYQFVYDHWLFINQTKVLDVEEVMKLEPSIPLDERTAFRNYSDVPWTALEQSSLDHINRHCFNYGLHCILDTQDGRLLHSDSEAVQYSFGLKVSIVQAEHIPNRVPSHYYYVLEDDITGQAFYIPPDLETFARPPNFPYERRFMILPILQPADRFITTRRHQIFVQNNRAHPLRQLPPPEPCNCSPAVPPARPDFDDDDSSGSSFQPHVVLLSSLVGLLFCLVR
ncbi:hypothetical protein M3Y99_01718600 [Aphelenchoides fujianensis]|nr:hypothetical protein M3Y99_01718600 [Aphelenchoides fujianensis]